MRRIAQAAKASMDLMKIMGTWVSRKFSRSERLGITAIGLAVSQTGCVVVGYSSRGGWFLWPGGLGLVLLVLLLLFLFNRR